MDDEIKYRSSFADRGWKAALVDLDGTLYRGDKVIEGAGAFIARLREAGIRPIFFTNNAMRTPQQVVAKLGRMEIEANLDEVCTSAQMAAFTIRQRTGAGHRIAALGQSGLEQALRAEDLIPVMAKQEVEVSKAEAEESRGTTATVSGVVVGLDLDVTYQQLAWICDHAAKLGSWILTNSDVRLPHGDGFLPGNGAIGAFVAAATGIEPAAVGKPNPAYVEFVLQRFGYDAAEVVVIGDNQLTDIACGNRAGVETIWVKTGVTYQDDEVTTKADMNPTYAANSVADLCL